VTLAAAAILWWALMREDVTLDGLAVPSFFAALGIFWLFVGWRIRVSN